MCSVVYQSLGMNYYTLIADAYPPFTDCDRYYQTKCKHVIRFNWQYIKIKFQPISSKTMSSK